MHRAERPLTRGAAASSLFACALSLLAACAKSAPTAGSSESHFLLTCNDECEAGLTCICGACSIPCQRDEECAPLAEGALCSAPSADAASCDEASALCDVECTSPQDCAAVGSSARCDNGRCRLDAEPSTLVDASTGGLSNGDRACTTHADCPPDMRCGYPLADGCDAVGECLTVGMQGDSVVYDQCTRTPGLSVGCIVRAQITSLPGGATMVTTTHIEEPATASGGSCDSTSPGANPSCDIRSQTAAQAVAAAVAAADSSCTTVDDCVYASNSTQCFASCGAVTSLAGADEIQAVIDDLDSNLCMSFEEDCGAAVVPPCIPPLGLACNAGQCDTMAP